MLVLGAQAGLLFGSAAPHVFPASASQPQAFAVVGMAAFFTGVVRAPLTGIVLITEMTAAVTLLLPMLGACFAAMLVPTLLRDTPIYRPCASALWVANVRPRRAARDAGRSRRPAGAAGGPDGLVALVGAGSVERIEDGREDEVGAAGDDVVPAFELEAQQQHDEGHREEDQEEAEPGPAVVGMAQGVGLGLQVSRLPLQGFDILAFGRA